LRRIAHDREMSGDPVAMERNQFEAVEKFISVKLPDVTPDNVDIAKAERSVAADLVLENQTVEGFYVTKLVPLAVPDVDPHDSRCPVEKIGKAGRHEADIGGKIGRRGLIGRDQPLDLRIVPARFDKE